MPHSRYHLAFSKPLKDNIPKMKIRNTTLQDLETVTKIYAYAQDEMIKNGNPHQWEHTYPKYEDVLYDVLHNNSYVIEKEGHICGVFSLLFGVDPTYLKIEGQWLNDHPYATIHRLASDGTQKGILKTALDYAFRFISDMRIDTYKDNHIMRNALKKYGFTYCGIIYLKNMLPRMAFHKCLAIETERLYLRKVVKTDVDAIYNNWAKHEIVTRYMTWLPHYDITTTKNIMKIWIEDYKRGDCDRFVIVLKSTDEPIGMIDVVDIEDGVPEVGYVLSPYYWNNGYMTEAGKAFINYLFEKGNKKISIRAQVDNIGSNRVIQKLGFNFIKTVEEPCSVLKPQIVKINCYELQK